MKEEIKNGVLQGYKIGENISIHRHINDPSMWFLTIRPLEVFGKPLCKKICTEAEISRYVHLILNEKLNTINNLIKEVIPFT